MSRYMYITLSGHECLRNKLPAPISPPLRFELVHFGRKVLQTDMWSLNSVGRIKSS